MNSDFGKALFSSYEEALRVSNSLVKKHKRGFNVYKIGSNWAIGGVHTKKIHNVKSFNELKEIYDSLAMIDSNDLVDDYFKDIEENSKKDDSLICGEADAWILDSCEIKQGFDIGFNNGNSYLCLKVIRGDDFLILKMGGKFSKYIPLLMKQCSMLRSKNVIWYTWNSRFKETNWSSSEWFYRIEEQLVKV